MQQVMPMDILKRQHTVISYLITYASRAREAVNRAAIGADMFPDSDCRATFLALLADDAEDDALLLELAENRLGPTGELATILFCVGILLCGTRLRVNKT